MGTSGAYGGSGKKTWREARERLRRLADTAAGDGAAGAGSDGGGAATDAQGPWADAVTSILDAISSDDPDLRVPYDRLPSLGALVSRPRGGGGGDRPSGGRGGVAGASGSSGRVGTGSRRAPLRAVRRGGAAIAAAYAIRERNADLLARLQLDLAELEPLAPEQQVRRILDAVVGQATHPDDSALRRATADCLRAIGKGELENPRDAIETFIANYTFQLSMVELRAQRDAGVDLNRLERIEREIKRLLGVRAHQASGRLTGVIRAADIDRAITQIYKDTVRVIRAGATA